MTTIEQWDPPTLPTETTEQLVRRSLAGWLLGFPSRHTKDAYVRGWSQWQQWCEDHDIAPLWPREGAGAAWVAEQRENGAAEASMRQRIAAVRGALSACARSGLATNADPFAYVKMPKLIPLGSLRMLSDEEMRALEDAANELASLPDGSKGSGGDHLTCFLLLSVCGLRASEVTQVTDEVITQSPVGPVASILRKANRASAVPLPPVVMQARVSAGRWPCDEGRTRSRHTVTALLATVSRRSGVEVHPHLLRHWFVSKALELGVPLQAVQDSAGHADPATTQAYNRRRNLLAEHAAHTIGEWFT